ncbi:hypothetical protein NQ315_008275 [Exocentrus adspersus]|uniref:DDE Tnp4 domain-containing protein n=1 Tax=Exocentrus adspersus TaxID=1586481 RepID=A0AAV8VMA8_9CUCU|nr:hypothetical protein NQ315_008275 [Exocentrus adspersus]
MPGLRKLDTIFLGVKDSRNGVVVISPISYSEIVFPQLFVIQLFNDFFKEDLKAPYTPTSSDLSRCEIFDSNLTILNVNARYRGAVHDAAIWEGLTIHRHLKRKYQEGTRNNYLLGDSGYPLQPWLMTPLPDALPNTPEAVYNERHIRTRNVAERGFGVWKARFRCLRKDRVLHYSHAAAARIIYACAVLHNAAQHTR